MTRSETGRAQSSWRERQIDFPTRITRSLFEHWPRHTPKPESLRKRSRPRDAHCSLQAIWANAVSPIGSRRMSIFTNVARRCAILTCKMRSKILERTLVAGICVGLAALVWFVFGQTIKFPFINFDDPEYVYEVPEINAGVTLHGIKWAFTHWPATNWFPLKNISLMLDFQFYGFNPGAFHFTNVVLHAAAVVLLFLVLRQMTSTSAARTSIWSSAFVTAIFAIHPLRAESVVWIEERKDVLSGFFFMLTLAAYLHYTRKPSIGRYLTMSILFAAGLLSKPMLVTTPFILLLLDYWPLNRSQRTEIRNQKAEIQIW